MAESDTGSSAGQNSIEDLVARAVAGERQALARLLSMVERGGEPVLEIEDRIAPHLGHAHIVGVTGPPGAGKSTLINALLPHARDALGRAAVLAVDPSSPFTRGAILGDRVRMQGSDFGSSVFIRSMASRGEMGGLARAAATSVRLFDACGWPLVIIETLGIGQVELDIMDLADTVMVVLNPGWGDSIQANKAGLTEAGDLFVINKADRPGAQQCRKDLLDSLSLLKSKEAPAVLDTVATAGEGLNALWQELSRQHSRLIEDDDLGQRRVLRRQRMVRKILTNHLHQRIEDALDSTDAQAMIARIAEGQLDVSICLRQLVEIVTRES